MAALALGCGPRPAAAPCPAPSASQAGAPRSSAEQRALLWQREAVRVRKILAACQTGACFGAASKGTQVSDPRLSRCLRPLEREAEALASSRSPYVYGASAWLLERAEQCVAEPGGSDDSPASRAIVAAEVQVALANEQQATKLLEVAVATAPAPAPAWQRARLLLVRVSLASLKARYTDDEAVSREALLSR